MNRVPLAEPDPELIELIALAIGYCAAADGIGHKAAQTIAAIVIKIVNASPDWRIVPVKPGGFARAG